MAKKPKPQPAQPPYAAAAARAVRAYKSRKGLVKDDRLTSTLAGLLRRAGERTCWWCRASGHSGKCPAFAILPSGCLN